MTGFGVGCAADEAVVVTADGAGDVADGADAPDLTADRAGAALAGELVAALDGVDAAVPAVGPAVSTETA